MAASKQSIISSREASEGAPVKLKMLEKGV